MSSKKLERALYGPSWTEVILGAVLSLALGGVLAAAVLIARPVQTVRELPKEPARGVIYYIEGSRDSTRGRQWQAKRQQLLAGESVVLTEEELNAAVGSKAATPAPAPAAPAQKGKAPAPKTPPPAAAPDATAAANAGGLIVPSAPNFRIHDNVLQVGVPCTVNVYGFQLPVVVMATGGFEKTDEGVVFAPDSFYIGSLQVNRLPALEGFVTKKIIAAQSIPEDLAAAWKKVSDASVEGKTLKLSL
jgi:hypothetical protein